jgi:SIR2-like protein
MKRRVPYRAIASLLQEGKVVPFLGAGINSCLRRSENDEWKISSPFLPRGDELSQYLADMSRFPSSDRHDSCDLAKVSSYYVEALGRDPLRECLTTVFSRNLGPSTIHRYLASIERPLLIVTTNYDDLTEKAFVEARRPYFLVSHLTDRTDWAEAVLWWKYDPSNPNFGKPEAFNPDPVYPSELTRYVDLTTTTVIYKMHGTVDNYRNEWNSYVITEDDYVDFLSRMTTNTAIPAMFIEYFASRHFLFLGYGLRDWNFRIVLRDLFRNRRPDQRRSWAIQYHPSELEKQLWDRRGVDIYDVSIRNLNRICARWNRSAAVTGS